MTKKNIELTDALAVKYRPLQFKHIVGNVKNISIIEGYFSQGKFIKSWLLSGASGSGKTTTARIMAMAINCEGIEETEFEPCLQCDSCKMALEGTHPDIKEFNAGSEDGKISGVEDILSTIRFKPRYNAKIITMDESHLMSNKAAQSLLKVLEEPPQRVMWILATTDPHKLPKAILGRCQKLYFEYPNAIDTAKRLRRITKDEYKKDIAERIKPFLIPIAEATNSQVRNALSVTESLAHIMMSKRNISDKELKSLFKDLLVNVGDVHTLSIRYITYMLSNSYALPLSMTLEIEQSRIDEFITLTTRHAHYASAYYTYESSQTLGLKEFYKIRKKFYGISFHRFDEALKGVQEKLLKKGISNKEIIRRSLAIASSLIAGMEKLRTGVIAKEQSVIFAIDNYVSTIERYSDS